MRTKILFILAAVVVIGIGGVFLSSGMLPQTDSATYAVHLNNGQVYFGHLVSVSRGTLTLSDAHFLELYEQKGDTVATSNSFSLEQAPKQVYRMIKRGTEKTLATDHTLFINREAVLFWEKLTPESDVVKLIAASQ